MRAFRLAASLIGGLLWAGTALGAEITHEGLTFSDEGGGFTLKGVTGRGSLDDPYVIVEDVTGPRQAVLIIRGLKQVGNRIGTHHIAGIAVTKIVFNRSEDTWQNYQMELREVSTRHSPYEDGLSFAQNTVIAGAFTASSFPDLQRYDEPQDTLGFSGNTVPPGQIGAVLVPHHRHVAGRQILSVSGTAPAGLGTSKSRRGSARRRSG